MRRSRIHRLFALSLVGAVLLLAAPCPASAQEPRGGVVAPLAPADSAGDSPGRPVPLGPAEIIVRPRPNAAPAFPASQPNIVAYNRAWYWLYFVGFGWESLGLILFLLVLFGPAMRSLVDARIRQWPVRAAVFYAAFSLIVTIWNLPVAWAGLRVERAYGFATLTNELWAADRLRGYLMGLAMIAGVWIGYILLERFPRTWWFWLWLAAIPWMFLQIVLWPVVIAPCYNDFRPLPDSHLKQRLLALADQAGIRGAQVFEVDSSRRTTKLNAYVSGLGPTKRIVLWDTTMRSLSEDEIVAITGHEMGHYVLNHVWYDLAANVAGAFMILGILSKMLPALFARLGPRMGLRAVHDVAGLPLILLVIDLLIFLQTPVAAAISRAHEHAADRYGLELTHLNVPMARAFAAFVTHDYGDPDPPPFIVFWLYSHPPLRDRIEFALHFHPWERAQVEPPRHRGAENGSSESNH